MATQVQWRGGSTAEHSTFTGAAREVTVDTQKKTLVVHDGSTAGGEPLLREDGSNSALNLGTNATPALKFAGDPDTGIYSPGADQVAISTNGTGKLFIDANGKVGIGTADPQDALHIAVPSAVLRLEDTDTNHISTIQSTAAALVLSADATDTVASSYLGLNVDGSERLRITSDGTVNIKGAGTAGVTQAVSFSGSAPVNSLVVQATTGNVGLGTSTPSDPLTVIGNTSGTMCTIQGSNTTSGYGLFVRAGGSDSGRYVATFQDAASNTRLHILSNGNVGIGTAQPGNKLTVIDRTTPIALRVGENDSATTEAGLRIQARNTANTTAYSLDISVDADEAAATFDFGGEERARITSDGKLLVGTTTTSAVCTALLQNRSDDGGPGTLYLSTTTTSPTSAEAFGRIIWTDSGHSPAVQIEGRRDGGTWTSGSSQPSKLVFFTTADGQSSPDPRMTITNAGYILIGNISSLPSASVFGLGLLKDGTGGAIYSSRNNTGSTAHVEFYNPNGKVGSISTNGSATAYNENSDYRLKENVVPLTGAADRVNQLQVHRFNFIADPDTTVDGFLAHEAQEVVPESVTGEKDAVDENGNPEYQGIDKSKLVPLLTAALQEALQKIETLEQRLNDAGIA